MKKKIVYKSGFLFVVGVVALGVFWLMRYPRLTVSFGALAPKGPVFVSILDGTVVTSSEAVVPQVVGVMIDNHPDARPQSGLGSAPVVYEAPAEGGITRFFAIFNASTSVSKVGPVRSARPYFLDWIKEYGAAPYIHVGGSPAALATLASDDALWDANQFWLDMYFWRSTDRYAPHNVYTSSDLWSKLITRYSNRHVGRLWEGWIFSVIKPSVTTTAKTLTIPYVASYHVTWQYNSDTNVYQRFIFNKAQLADTGEGLYANTVVVQMVQNRVLDEVGREEITTVGSGEAWVLRDGKLVHGTWKKTSPLNRTRFYDENNSEVSFVPGRTWVQVVPLSAMPWFE